MINPGRNAGVLFFAPVLNKEEKECRFCGTQMEHKTEKQGKNRAWPLG